MSNVTANLIKVRKVQIKKFEKMIDQGSYPKGWDKEYTLTNIQCLQDQIDCMEQGK